MVRVRSADKGWQIAKDCSFTYTIQSQKKLRSSSVGFRFVYVFYDDRRSKLMVFVPFVYVILLCSWPYIWL